MHQFYLDPEVIRNVGDPGVAHGIARGQFVQALILAYLMEMGIDPNLVTAMVSAGPSEVYWLNEDEILRWNVDNMQERRKPWWVEAYKGGAVAVMQSTFGEQPTDTLTLFCRADESNQAYLMLSKDWHDPCRSIPLSALSVEFPGGLTSAWTEAEINKGAGSPGVRFGKSGPTYLWVPISKAQTESLLRGDPFALDVSLPPICSFGWGIYVQFDEASIPTAALVLRNCI